MSLISVHIQKWENIHSIPHLLEQHFICRSIDKLLTKLFAIVKTYEQTNKNSCNHRNWFHIADKKKQRGEKTFAKSKK